MKKTITFDVSAEEVKEILAEWFGVKPDNVEAYTECQVEKEFDFPEKTITGSGVTISYHKCIDSSSCTNPRNGVTTLTSSYEGGER